MASIAEQRTSLKIVPLSRETLQDRVYRRLCDMILDGEIEPGQLVTIQSIADACGVSHMPVREALKRLMAANALTVVSGRSIGIPRLSRATLDDLRNVRLEVESLAAVWAARQITGDELLRLDAECQRLGAANAAGDVKEPLNKTKFEVFVLVLLAVVESIGVVLL